MTRNKDVYRPRPDTAQMLDRAYDLVQSVPYQVSARWVFYRLLQEGYYKSKSDYGNKFLKAVSLARHGFYNGWQPDTLADETREITKRGGSFDDERDWLFAVQRGMRASIDRWITQPYYVELWFEARAMLDQFRHYTEHITLVPMGGQPSIPYKWEAAKRIEKAVENYGTIPVILYFGDLDPAGMVIAETIKEDVWKWCDEDFTFIRAGLNPGDPEKYDIPENPEKPGEYQWEALSDTGAREIINRSVGRYIDEYAFKKIKDREDRVTLWTRDKMSELVVEWEMEGMDDD